MRLPQRLLRFFLVGLVSWCSLRAILRVRTLAFVVSVAGEFLMLTQIL